MKQNKQSGFSTVVALLVVVVIAAIGFGSWYVWHSNHDTKDTKVTTNDNSSPTKAKTGTSQTQSTKPATTYLTITSSQKVRLPLTTELGKLTAGTVKDSGYGVDKSVAVLAPELDASWKCAANADGTKGTIGSISITMQAKRAGPGDPATTKKIGDYTYGFEPGAANCTTSATYGQLVSAFKKQFSALETY